MQILYYIYSWTWFLWPFVFVFSLSWGIREWVKDDCCSAVPLLVAGVALNIIVAGILCSVS
jgi:hypothetical protein